MFLLPCDGNALGAALGQMILSDDSRPVSDETDLGEEEWVSPTR